MESVIQPRGPHGLRIACATSGHAHPAQAAEYVARSCAESLRLVPPEDHPFFVTSASPPHAATDDLSPPVQPSDPSDQTHHAPLPVPADEPPRRRVDLAIVFLSSHHIDASRAIMYAIRRRLNPGVLLGVSGQSVLGGETELENAPGVSLFAASMPGVTLRPFRVDQVPMVRDGSEHDAAALAHATGISAPNYRGTILLCDPFSVPTNIVFPSFSHAWKWSRRQIGERDPGRAPIVGGMASAANKPGGNVVILGDTVLRSGGVGVSLAGNVKMDVLVSQGCRPIGQPWVVTGAKGQMLTSLGGRPALRVLSDMLDSMTEDQREYLRKGLFLGRVINEYKPRFGRDDFLIRNIVGVERNSEAIVVADVLKVGQTVQFHVRDKATAAEDLALLLDAQRLYERPAGGLLFTCNGRGSKLFDEPHHDAKAVARAFSPLRAGAELAKGGTPIEPAMQPPPDDIDDDDDASPPASLAEPVAPPEPQTPEPSEHSAHTTPPRPSVPPAAPPRTSRGPMPLAGFFCSGEIGPVGDEAFVHGQTACLALFRNVTTK